MIGRYCAGISNERLRYQRTRLDEPSLLDVTPANHEGSTEVELAYTVVSNGSQKGKENWQTTVASVTL